jgi:hypothetical protein
MLSLLTPRQSEKVGGPIGSLREAKTVASYPNYDAAYLAKRLGAANPMVLQNNRYDTTGQFSAREKNKELVYLQNATKGYEAEAEECLKREFKDWLEGKHNDNLVPHTHNNRAGGGVRRDMHGKQVDNWVPTWWGPNQLTYLPGVREYLREQAIRADKNSLDLNVLAHLGPQNVEEAWAYFKHWVKGRPVGPEECLNPSSLDPSNTDLPNRAGPIHMQHNTQLHPDRPYNPITGLPPWPAGGGGGGGGGWGFGLGGPRPGPPPSENDSDDDDDDWLGALVPAAKNVTPPGMYRGRAETGQEYFFGPSGSEWATVNAAADRALEEVAALNVESQLSSVRQDGGSDGEPANGSDPFNDFDRQALRARARNDPNQAFDDFDRQALRAPRARNDPNQAFDDFDRQALRAPRAGMAVDAYSPMTLRLDEDPEGVTLSGLDPDAPSPEPVDLTLSRLRRGATTSPNRVPLVTPSRPTRGSTSELSVFSPQDSRFPVYAIPTPDPTGPFAPPPRGTPWPSISPPPNSAFSSLAYSPAPVSSPLSMMVDDPRAVPPALVANRSREAETRRRYEQATQIRQDWRRRASLPQAFELEA